MTGKPALVGVGLFVPGTGFTRVLESLFEQLSPHAEIHWLGIGYKDARVQREHYTLYPCNPHGGDLYGAYGAVELAEQVKAKTIFLLNDLYILKNYAKAWTSLREKNTRLVVYAPLDGTITDPASIKDCSWPDDLVLYNQWALQSFGSAQDIFGSAQDIETFAAPRLHAINHGVDRHVFYPPADAAEQKRLKQELFDIPGAADTIFILNANRYNERKDIETTIAAFAGALPHFKRPARLCLHTPHTDPQLKTTLETVIANSGCGSTILLNPLGEEYTNDSSLVKLFQACSIGINTSLGEGWGMISFEHAACGAAQVVPDHTAPAELWKNAAILIPKARPVQLPTNPFGMYASDTAFLSKELVKLVNDENYLADVSNACYNRAAEDRFDWKVIGEQWRKLIMGI